MSNNVNLAQVIALINSMGGGSGGGTSDYSALTNKPQVDGVELNGNKSLADFGYPIFYWDGKGSDTDASTIELWKKITQYCKIKPVLVVVKYDTTYSGIMIIDKDFFSGSPTTKYPRTSLIYIGTGINTTNNSYTFTENKYTIRTDISMLGEDIISVRKSYVVSNVLTVLTTGAMEDEKYFKPTKKSQPVSKGFLDEQIGNISTVLDAVNGEVI